MRVLVACEFSGVVRRAFRDRGHNAWSCDLLDAEDGSPHHIKGDAQFAIRSRTWDLVIAHPPCTHIAVCGNRWYAGTQEREDGVAFVRDLWESCRWTARVCFENPISVLSSRWMQPTQVIQPWQFGHGETKATCLWLHELPKLEPTRVVKGREQRIWKMAPSAGRSMERSRTYPGVARAMAKQWG